MKNERLGRFLICDRCNYLFATHSGKGMGRTVAGTSKGYEFLKPGQPCDKCSGKIICVDADGNRSNFTDPPSRMIWILMGIALGGIIAANAPYSENPYLLYVTATLVLCGGIVKAIIK